MTRPEQTDASEKAAWAGADDEAEQAAEAVEAEIVDDAPPSTDSDADGTAADAA
ncbi:nucleotide exchange factor GrpE, partial [Dietzia schimae]|nr:nucleotide exchange factor GrpE [Dietzia kunjamensis subsp. schimae]